MSTVIVLGAQWGDEGKGKVVDLFSKGFHFVARFQGGHNAGHTVIVAGTKYVFHLVPSGILHGCKCVLGNGMVIDPTAFLEETASLTEYIGNIAISNRAHLITPWHVLVEQARAQVGSEGIGTTGRGIGPAYEDKMARVGITAGATTSKSLLRKLAEASCKKWEPQLSPVMQADLPRMIDEFVEAASRLATFVADTSSTLRHAIKDGARVLVEGAQGAMLDVDHGTYPFVTSSSTVAGGACTGLGIPPTAIDAIVGVAKAYTTRVGNGPFPTELFNDVAGHIVRVGQEFGASTGRRRRPGWIDLVQLRYAIGVNGIQALVLTKADVLAGLGEVGLCTSYRCNGSDIEQFPADLETLQECTPGLLFEPGWGDISGITEYDKLPKEFRDFVTKIEDFLRIPVKVISTGPERHQIIVRPDVFVPNLGWMDSL